MATIIKSQTHTKEDIDGNITVDKLETSYQKDNEPDYIKLYTKVWCEFNEIPVAYRNLFIELVQRMTYCNSKNLENSQIVYTGTPFREAIMETLGWKSKNMYQKGLKKLTEAKAIRKVSRGVYQVNPTYAGKGAWRYNQGQDRGGVKDLIATFNFIDKTVNTEIIWEDDGKDTEYNKNFREGIGVNKNEHTILSLTKITPEELIK